MKEQNMADNNNNVSQQIICALNKGTHDYQIT